MANIQVIQIPVNGSRSSPNRDDNQVSRLEFLPRAQLDPEQAYSVRALTGVTARLEGPCSILHEVGEVVGKFNGLTIHNN